jgi:hypothetical protein
MDMRRARIFAVLMVWLASLLACQKQSTAGAEQPRGRAAAARDLSIDESRGGHTLKRHVGRTDEQLRERLQQERNISAASTYTDRQTAERAVGIAISDNRDKVERWLRKGKRRPNLVLDYTEPNDAVGRVMNRGAMGSVPCDHAIVVLKADGSSDYFVLTSYPECRP